jgi:hypothetical protein
MAKDRSWAVRADEYVGFDDFRNAVRQSLLDIEAITFREGGAVIVAPIRVEVDVKVEGVREFETMAVRFTHTYLPAARSVDPPPPEEEEGGAPEQAEEAQAPWAESDVSDEYADEEIVEREPVEVE